MQTIRQNSRQAGSSGAIGVVIIIILLIVGVFYVFKSREATAPTDGEAVENEIPSDEELTVAESSLNSQSESDDLYSIEGDLQATSFESL